MSGGYAHATTIPCGASSGRSVSASPRTAYFAGAYARVAEHADQPGGRRDGDEVPAAALDHRRHDGADRVQRAEVVDLHLVAEHRVVELLEVPGVRATPAAVTSDVARARPLGRAGRRPLAARRGRVTSARRRRPTAAVGDRARPCATAAAASRPASRATSDTARASRREQSRGREPDAARSAGDRPRARHASVGHAAIVPRRAARVPSQGCRVARSSCSRSRALVLAVAPSSTRSPRAGARPSTAPSRAGSVEQVAVTGAGSRRDRRSCVDADGKPVATPAGRRAGQHAVPRRAAGLGLRRRGRRHRAPTRSRSSSPTDTPPPSLYTDQQLGAGFGYLKTRDGTLLSVNVKLPGPAEHGPYPTVVEYSGYDPSNPDGRQPASAHRADPRLRDRRREPARHRMLGRRVRLLRDAPVARRLRRDRDRRRAAVGRARHGRHGRHLVPRASRSCSSRRRRPPHLAAITPLSVLDDTYDTLYPGGIFNNGFALGWAEGPPGRRRDPAAVGVGAASASPTATRPARATRRCGCRRPTCSTEIARQRVPDRVPATDALAPGDVRATRSTSRCSSPARGRTRRPAAHFANMLDDFAPDIPVKATLMNGLHQDSLGPAVLARWVEFLDFYVAAAGADDLAGARARSRRLLLAALVRRRRRRCPPDRFTGQPTTPPRSRAYEAEPPVRVLFDVGAGGRPARRCRRSRPPSASWPLPADAPRPRGTSAPTARSATDAPAAPAAPTATDYDPAAFPRTDAERPGADDGDGFASAPTYDWKPLPDGQGGRAT